MLNDFKQRGLDIENPLDMQSESAVKHRQERNELLIKKNSLIIIALIALALTVLLVYSFYIQIVKGSYYKDIAENNRIREMVIRAPRGLIKDSKGTILARNIPNYEVVFVPAHLSQKSPEKERAFEMLSSLLSMNVNEIKATIPEESANDKKTYLLKEDVSPEVALEIIERANELSGIYIGKTARRQYVDGSIFSHMIGYDGKVTKEELKGNPFYIMTDYIGKNGVEYSYESYLHGQHGIRRFEVYSDNSIKEDLGVINPTQGKTLILHVDADLQRHINNVLGALLEKNEDATGAVVVALDPRNGGVRALVNIPSYDNNLFAKKITTNEYQDLISDRHKPLLNRAISGEYPPGSTFKPMIAAIGLQEGVITKHTSLNCPGSIRIGEWIFPDWKTHGHTDVKKAIAESCDVFFYAVGGGWNNISGLGINKMNRYCEIFGFGDILGIDLPGEAAGNMPDEDWKFKKFGEKWYIGDSYHAAIGQGFVAVTPLQLASAIATIANGGTLYRPHVADAIIDIRTGKERKIKPEIIEDNFIAKENIRIVQEGMRETVAGSSGSGRSLNSLKITSAGKTGTSQFGNEDKTHSWYVAFAPYENPEIAMVVLFEGGGDGHSWAVPAAKEILKWYFDEERGTKTENGEDE
ncbi:MAG: penicillin-binding protein 2 [Patescibacteria group bacterium]|nr:penicillin-binding protein 2 [Patescibacteria group bacterium]